MKVVLHYRGPLRTNGDALNKAKIREVFHAQLAKFWAQDPLKFLAVQLDAPASEMMASLKVRVGKASFVPLVSSSMLAMAELRVLMLRPGPPGQLLSQGGDIDNRLKTLFDALSIPQLNQIPRQMELPDPCYCLLEDDSLVTSVEVRAEQLLEDVDPSTVDLTVSVQTRVSTVTYGNMVFA
jgi:hypothetical protein